MKGWALACTWLWAWGCQPLPPRACVDAGLIALRGVTLDRMEKDLVRLHLRAPQASLGLDGDRVVMQQVEGWAQPGEDGGTVVLHAQSLNANLQTGHAVITGGTATDAQQRTLAASHMHLEPDGGTLWADGPVTLRGGNFNAVAQGGARVDLLTLDTQLEGPVEAHTFSKDAGHPPW